MQLIIKHRTEEETFFHNDVFSSWTMSFSLGGEKFHACKMEIPFDKVEDPIPAYALFKVNLIKNFISENTAKEKSAPIALMPLNEERLEEEKITSLQQGFLYLLCHLYDNEKALLTRIEKNQCRSIAIEIAPDDFDQFVDLGNTCKKIRFKKPKYSFMQMISHCVREMECLEKVIRECQNVMTLYREMIAHAEERRIAMQNNQNYSVEEYELVTKACENSIEKYNRLIEERQSELKKFEQRIVETTEGVERLHNFVCNKGNNGQFIDSIKQKIADALNSPEPNIMPVVLFGAHS